MLSLFSLNEPQCIIVFSFYIHRGIVDVFWWIVRLQHVYSLGENYSKIIALLLEGKYDAILG